jgi:hypothetical protein
MFPARVAGLGHGERLGPRSPPGLHPICEPDYLRAFGCVTWQKRGRNTAGHELRASTRSWKDGAVCGLGLLGAI